MAHWSVYVRMYKGMHGYLQYHILEVEVSCILSKKLTKLFVKKILVQSIITVRLSSTRTP
jgi:hypothetical protein